MSVTTCRQCRKTIPADSVRCPTCDILNPGKRDFLAVGVTLIVVFGVVYAVWRTVAWITTPSEDTPSLTAEVRFADSQIQIENNDTYAGTLCTVTLNSGNSPRELITRVGPDFSRRDRCRWPDGVYTGARRALQPSNPRGRGRAH
jgi:hypothetical protein